MSLATKVLIELAVLIAAFVCGYAYHTPDTKIVTKVETKTNTVVQQVDHVVTKTVTVKETSPTKVVKETVTVYKTEDKSVKETAKVATEADKKGPIVAPDTEKKAPNYSAGVQWNPSWKDPTWKPSTLEGGYRVIGGLWGTASYNWNDNTGTVGVRYEF